MGMLRTSKWQKIRWKKGIQDMLYKNPYFSVTTGPNQTEPFHTPFTNSIMRIIYALFGHKIGTGPELSALFRCCNYPHNSHIGIRFRICERNSNIMRIISKVRSKVTFCPHAHPSFWVFFLMAARKKSADYFRVFRVLWAQVLLNYPHNSYADNWGILLWKGY